MYKPLKGKMDTLSLPNSTVPIYKAYLQGLANATQEMKALEQQATEQAWREVKNITEKVIKAAEAGNKWFIYNNRGGLVSMVSLVKSTYMKGGHYVVTGWCGENIRTKNIIPDIVEKLKLKFPDSIVTGCPINSYIYISWE
jgi:hypothetical protein